MGLFPALLDDTEHKGIDLAPKTIPPEVFDKHAVAVELTFFQVVVGRGLMSTTGGLMLWVDGWVAPLRILRTTT